MKGENPARATSSHRWPYLAAALLLIILVSGLVYARLTWSAPNPCAISKTGAISLPNNNGRIDHMAYNPVSKLLVVAARNNNSLAVANATGMYLVKTLDQFSLPQWAAFVDGGRALVVTNGGNGTVSVLNSSDFARLASINLTSDADNLAVDPASSRLYVGYGSGGIAIINTTNWKVSEQVPMVGHPEAMRVEETGQMLFVNVPAGNYIAVLDKTNGQPLGNWPVANASAVYPMALDEGHHLLFVASRSPSQLIAINTSDGARIAAIAVPGDADDVFFDPNNDCVYVSSGDGAITVVKESSGNALVLVASLQTYPGARTSLLDASTGLYFLAVPQSGNSSAMVVVYRVGAR